jgi:hypothetical protein
MTRAALALLACFAMLLAAGPLSAQGAPRDGLMLPFDVVAVPETVAVGEPFRVQVSVWLPPGSWMVLEPPDSTGRVQAVDSARTLLPDSMASVFHAQLTMVAWRAGPADSVGARVGVVDPDGGVHVSPVWLKVPAVRTVLEADSTRWKVREVKDVYGASYDWRLYALLALAALIVLGSIYALVRRWRNRPRPPVPPLTARQKALATLERAGASGLIEAGDWRGFYTLVSGALRGYAESLDGRWSADLTTWELLDRMRGAGLPSDAVDPLVRLLETADLAKFARYTRTSGEARADLAEARRWVETFDRGAASSEAELAAAGSSDGGFGSGSGSSSSRGGPDRPSPAR